MTLIHTDCIDVTCWPYCGLGRSLTPLVRGLAVHRPHLFVIGFCAHEVPLGVISSYKFLHFGLASFSRFLTFLHLLLAYCNDKFRSGCNACACYSGAIQ
jgi:hypothetical protein